MIMVGSIRPVRVTLAPQTILVGLACGFLTAGPPAALAATQATGTAPAAKQGAADKASQDASGRDQAAQSPADDEKIIVRPGEDPPRPFVPLRPSTVDDRRRIESVRLYTAARALEDQGAWADAAALLQDALKLDPDSMAVARRLCRLYVGALARPELAVEYGKRVLANEPGDTDTLSQLVDYFRKFDPAGAEGLLTEVLANPKLDAHSPGRLLAQFELGKLYIGRLREPEKAAEMYAKVLEGLDDKSANRLSPSEQMRILTHDPAQTYLHFGMVFIAAKRNELAVKALERGLIYDEDNSQISLLLAETLVKINKGEQALSLVDRFIERQTPFVEAYELLAKVLKALKREKEITPRLEAAARRDSKNVPLQYVLADRYRETGENEKAEALYRDLLRSQPTPQTYRALAASLFKRRKAADLLKVTTEASSRPDSQDAIKPLLQAVVVDDSMSEEILDVGVHQLETNPAGFSRPSYVILAIIANNPGSFSTNRVRRLEKLLRIQRLLAAQNPSDELQNEICDSLRRMGNYAEAAAEYEQLLAKRPALKTVEKLVNLADMHRRAGHMEAVKATLREAMKRDPGERSAQSQLRLGTLLSDIGQPDDAASVLREATKKEPANYLYDLFLGNILTKYGRNDEAIKVLEGLLKRFADNEDVVKDARAMLSVVYVNQGDYKKGEAELEVLLARYPDEPGPNNDLGYLYAEQGKNLEKAESMIRKALQGAEKREYLDSLGWVLFKRGKAKEAIEPLKKAAELMKVEIEQDGANPDSTILEHLGDVYFQLQELDKASDSWRQAAQAAEHTMPPDKRLPEIRKKIESLQKLGPVPKPASGRTP
jgi:tetratricopeptide (TPR) repeat protein